MGKTTVTVFVSEEMKEGLKKLADVEQRSLSQMAAILLQQGLAKAKEEGKIQQWLKAVSYLPFLSRYQMFAEKCDRVALRQQYRVACPLAYRFFLNQVTPDLQADLLAVK